MANPAVQVKKRSVRLAGHRTSVSLEQPFWDALKDIAAAEGIALAALVERIDRTRNGNLSSALRVYVLDHLRARLDSTGGANGR